jgi:hypothetical protein
MKNPNMQYPGDLGCSYDSCPNRHDIRVKRGNLMPLGEMQSFAAGTVVHRACLERILRSGNGPLDSAAEISDNTEVAEQEGL